LEKRHVSTSSRNCVNSLNTQVYRALLQQN
jgi:hypothetical protein